MRKSGLLPEFCNLVSELFIPVIEAAQVHLIKGATLSFVSQVNADDVERALIAFFDYPSLLNLAKRGYFANYVPAQSNQGNLSAVGTDFYHKFGTLSNPINGETVDRIPPH